MIVFIISWSSSGKDGLIDDGSPWKNSLMSAEFSSSFAI